ncbi:MAG: hypothetical protein U0228_07590 [Myxococcaceae bacterium]
MTRVLGLVVVVVSGLAWADEPPVAAPAAALEPPPAPKQPTPPPEPPSARDRRLGSLGIGFLGTANVFKAQPDNLVGPLGQLTVVQRTTVPILGVRFWMKQWRLGLEAGVGAMVSGSYSDAPVMPGGQLGEGPATTELLLHLSVPIALASTQHVILFIAPEFRGGFSRFQPDASGAGVVTAGTYDVSAKVGAEIFFSFLGLDNLSIEAGVRLGVVHEARYVVTSLPLQPVNTAVSSQTRFSTSLIANPWDLFTSTLAAKYYF